MPSIPKDINILIRNKNFYFTYLPIKNIYISGSEALAEIIKRENDKRLIFVNENKFVDIAKIRELYSSRTDKNSGRAGWYIQQFIKMEFARFAQDEYYLIWDSDTIPLKPVKMFNDEAKPFFDMKTEFYRPYFKTIKNLFPDIHKVVKLSFISEHMLIKSEYMREIISEIESNTQIQGLNFQEKIINSIDIKNLPGSGFSEFETYGSYVTIRHPESYVMRRWYSLRTIKRFYNDASEIDDVQRDWLKKKYDAVSIEKWQKKRPSKIWIKSDLLRKICGPVILECIDFPAQLNSSIIRFIRSIIPSPIKTLLKRLLGRK